MPVLVVQVGHVGVRMPHRLVPVHVTVLAGRHRIVNVAVMPVVMPVRVFVLQRLVLG